ncbi:hypothetical protein HNP86_000644 [Methanococcus maripaludis]|uniref:Peptide O-xylosyltransferase n=1 Tax=Methanococcus maripaludis TaxID=39152 RepID=A0A7J9NU64_METMI|nr:beta-1,6-N-acetylglucosaminyltransferase [Methanococcus maripaludis]MBA2850513.1 hypothetical protein [Methanococcus maripaludis]
MDKIIAYLISAHNQEKHLYNLINRLNNEKVHFFVHIDKKSELDKFSKLNEFKNLTFVEERINVNWKGFSQVESTIKLLKCAITSGISFKHFVFLSGSDYPIKSNQHILDFFSNSEKNYIDFKKISDDNSIISYLKNRSWRRKLTMWHFYDTLKINWNAQGNQYKLFVYRVFIICNLILNLILPKRKFFKEFKAYGGSQWWSIDENTVKYILEFYENNLKFINYYKYTDSPDEMFFQTLILNSPFKENTVNDNLRYIDWSLPVERPKILIEEDFEKIINSDKLFARKFNNKRSKKLIAKINGVIEFE